MAVLDDGFAEDLLRTTAAGPRRVPAARLVPLEVRVDIVINNYNYGRFLALAIESALAQTHRSVTVIAVDDGSTDDSREILADYADRVDVLLKENGGQASALNAGLARCRGDVVIFLDADDVLEPEIAAKVADIFAQSPGTVHVPYRLAVVDGDGHPNGLLKPSRDLDLPGGEIAEAKLTFPFDIPTAGTSGNAFSVSALRTVAPIPEAEFAACADWYLVHVLPLLGRVTPLDQVGGQYRVHGCNAYEQDEEIVELDHVRKTVTYAAATTAVLERVSAELGLTLPFVSILSVSDLANRLVSLRLDPQSHPVQADTVPRLLRDGMRAALRRWDSSTPMKALFVVWFLLVAIAPRPLLVRLALILLFRERRIGVNRVVSRLARTRRQLEITQRHSI